MENRDNKVTSGLGTASCKVVQYVATFENHYKAMLFKKGMGQGCVLKPVPRLLSSSCGTAAFFQGSSPMSLDSALLQLADSVYRFEEGKEGDKNGGYKEVYSQ